MDYFLLYLILRLDSISTTSEVFAAISGILFAIALFVYILNPEPTHELVRVAAKPWISRFGIPFVIILFLAVMIPDTKQTAVIYCLPKVVNNEQVQKMPDNLLKLANQWIDEQIDETAKVIEN